jgi:hypothetical protein
MTEREYRQIWVSREGQTIGPYSVKDVQAYLASGQLKKSDTASWEGDSEWSNLENILGFSKKEIKTEKRMDDSFSALLEVPACGGWWMALITLALTAVLTIVTSNASPVVTLSCSGGALLLGNVGIIILWQLNVKPRSRLRDELRSILLEKIGSFAGMTSFLATLAEDYGKEQMKDSISNLDPMSYGKGFLATQLGELFVDKKREAEQVEVATKLLLIEQAIEKTGRSYAYSTAISFLGILALIKPFIDYMNSSYGF